MLKRAVQHGRWRDSSGFTLIELLVTISILAIALGIAVPSFSKALMSYRVRNASEVVVSGLNLARAEAVRRNASATFNLNAGGAWTVQVGGADVQSRSAVDLGGLTASSNNASSAVIFLPTGMVDTSTTPWMTRINVSSTVAGTEQRQIDILGGGLIRVCEPGITAANDPRRC